jgi:hypothetical protein
MALSSSEKHGTFSAKTQILLKNKAVSHRRDTSGRAFAMEMPSRKE